MPRAARCPTCHAAVPVPADPDADRVCPACDEVIPAPRRVKAQYVYDPEDEEAYTVRAAGPDRDRADKARKADAILRAERLDRRAPRRRERPPVLGGVEVVLLVFAAVAAVAVAVGYFLARRSPTAPELILLAVASLGMTLRVGAGVWRARGRVER